MKSMIRVVLVDPNEESRQSLQRLLGGLGSIWLAEAFASYQAAASSLAELAPDLTLVVLDSDADQGVALIQAVVRDRPESIVLPASRSRDSDLILRSIRAGAREFLTLPADLDELLGAIHRLVPDSRSSGTSARRGSQVVAIAGAAGGIGCTTLAVNLATNLAAEPDSSVALADFDLLLGAVDICLDIIPDQTLMQVVQNVDRLDLTLLKRTLTRHVSGLHVLPHPVAMEDVARIDPEALRRAVGLLKAAYQTVIIDTSKALQASDFIAFEMADTILLVIQLELSCLRNSARLLQLFRQYEGMAERVRVVVNRAELSVSEISLKKAEETLNLPASFQIPNAFRAFSRSQARGVPIEMEAPGSKAHQAILEIARGLRPPVPAGPKGPRPRSRLAALFF